MTIYAFRGRNAEGQPVNGQVDASSPDAAATQLLNRGVTPIALEEQKSQQGFAQYWQELTQSRRVETVELIMFCRQMYTITKAGIPLVKGLRGLSASLRNPTFQKILLDIIERLESGVELSTAMRYHPKVFNQLFISMVSVGEGSGRLDLAFHQLSEYMERDLETIKSIKTALRYPSFLYSYIQTPEGSRQWGKKKLRVWIVGDIIERASMARYARSFGLMMKAGLPISNALELSARAIDNPYLGDKVRAIRAGIERGEGLFQTHQASGMFTPLVLQMISVGEESGQVDVLLEEVAAFYEREVAYDVKKLSDRIEPIMIIIMAGFVTVLALGIFLPMWDMYNIQKA